MISLELTFYFAFTIIIERTKGVELYASETPNLYTEKIEWKDVKQISSIEYTQEHITKSTTRSTEARV